MTHRHLLTKFRIQWHSLSVWWIDSCWWWIPEIWRKSSPLVLVIIKYNNLQDSHVAHVTILKWAHIMRWILGRLKIFNSTTVAMNMNICFFMTGTMMLAWTLFNSFNKVKAQTFITSSRGKIKSSHFYDIPLPVTQLQVPEIFFAIIWTSC